jgi:hypothetical protein
LITCHELHREALRSTVALYAESTRRLSRLEADCAQAATKAAVAQRRAEAAGSLVAADTDRIRSSLLDRWDREREIARQAAQAVLGGPGRFGFRRGAVARAGERLTAWHATWARHLPGLPADNARLVGLAVESDNRPAIWAALDAAARRGAERAHPEYAEVAAAADAAGRAHHAAHSELDSARCDHDSRYGTTDQADYARQLTGVERALAATHQELTDARARTTTLLADPAILAQPPERLRQESEAWRARRDAARPAARIRPRPAAAVERSVRHPRPEDLGYLQPRPGPGRGISR